MTFGELVEEIFKDKRLAVGILIGLCLLVYFNSLNGAFVSDDLGILKDRLLTSPGQYLFSGKLVKFTFSINYFLGRFSPFIYHFTNLLFHLGVVVLVYLFLLEITKKEIAFIASVIFAVHPIHVEAISWISGRPYPLGGLFFLGALLLYINAFKKEKFFWYFYLGSLVCYFLAHFAEVKSIAFVLIIGLYELVFGDLRQRWLKLIPYFLLTLTFLLILIGPLKVRVATENPEFTGGVELMNPIQQIPIALSSYLELFVWPKNLTLYHEDLTVSMVNYLVRLGVFVALLASLIYFFIKKQKLLFFSLGVFIFSLVPTMLPVRIAWVVAERYVYFGSIGLCLIVGWVLFRFLKKYPQVLLVLVGIIVILLSARTINRNQDWRTREALWLATAQVSPTSSKAWNNMGDIYSGQGKFDLALRSFQRAIELRPNYIDAYHNVGVTYLQMEEFDQAIEWFEKAIAIYPIPQSYHDMGVCYFYKGDFQKAEELFRKVLELDPNSTMAYNSLGLLYFKQGKYEETRQYWQKALQIDPYHEGIQRNLLLLEQQLQASPAASPQ